MALDENEFGGDSASGESLNIVHSYALMAGAAYAFQNFENSERLNFLKQISLFVDPKREDKADGAYSIINSFLNSNDENDRQNYSALINAFSNFSSIKDKVKEKIKGPEDLKENRAWFIAFVIFGYGTIYSSAEEFWDSFRVIQNRIDPEVELVSLSDLDSIFGNGSELLAFKLNYLSSAPQEKDIVYILKYINVSKFFTGVAPPDPTLMKDCEIQSYRISGQITPKYFTGSAADLLIFNPNLGECQQIVSGGETGFSFYPCAKESTRPRELIFNQLIFDGPYNSGSSETADLGIPILRELENETYTQDRTLQKTQQMGDLVPDLNKSYIASYNNGWVFDEFTDLEPNGFSASRFLSFIGDIASISSIDFLKKFPSGHNNNPTTGNFHFLGKREIKTGQNVLVYNVGDVGKIGSGFSPILFRLNKKENDEIYSGLEINLFDKVKNSGVLMAYSLSPDSGILSSHRAGKVKFPSLNIENNRPSLPFMGINADFSSEKFNINPSVKFNFGVSTYSPLYGTGLEASDFSFTGFNFTGKIFPLSSGKIKYTTEISPSGIKPVSPAFTTLFDEDENPIISNSKFLLQKALGFPLTGDCLPKSDAGVFYGIDYSYYNGARKDVPYNLQRFIKSYAFYSTSFWFDLLRTEGMERFALASARGRFDAYPPDVEDFAKPGIMGDSSMLKYIGDHTKKISGKQVFGPLDEPSDSNLGVGFNQRITSIENPADEDYKYVRNLNPARYYSGLFASNKKVFLYPEAENVYNSGSIFNAAKKSFPNKISVTYEVEEQYFKKVSKFARFKFKGASDEILNSLKDEIWVDKNFSHPNAFRVWTYKPGNPGVNLNGIIYTGLNFPLEIEKGSISNIHYETFFDVQQDGNYASVNHTITPLSTGKRLTTKEDSKVEKKSKYEITVDYTYMPPIKSLSDWQNYPIHAHRAFVSTGKDTLIDVNLDPIHFPEFDGKWSEALNKVMTDYSVNYGRDPLFLADLDLASAEEPKSFANKNVLNQNLSGDAWNGFYIKSGAVFFPERHPPYRDTPKDCRLFLFHNNLKENRIFIRNADIFPAFIHSPFDSSFSGKNLADFCFPGEKFTRQNKNFADPSTSPFLGGGGNNSCFEITGLSLFSGGLDKEISYKIQKTGTLYHIPKEMFDSGLFLPEITRRERGTIDKFYPELKDFNFYSSVEAFSESISGYYLDYEEGSEIKIKKKSFKVYSGIFPHFDQVFAFENSGKLAFSGEFSYNSQEESCIVTHGIQLNEKENKKDKFQEMKHRFSYISPVLKNRTGVNITYDATEVFSLPFQINRVSSSAEEKTATFTILEQQFEIKPGAKVLVSALHDASFNGEYIVKSANPLSITVTGAFQNVDEKDDTGVIKLDQESYQIPINYQTFDFPTKQVSRKNKIISGENKFANKNMGSPDYHNHFYMGVLPEFCFFSQTRSVIGAPGQDNIYYPNSEIISSSSYDHEEEYEDGSFYKMETIDKEYQVAESKRFYDSTFCDAVFNSGSGFIEILPIGDSLNSNSECKQFWGPNGTFISEMELGNNAINFISETKDRKVDISDIPQKSSDN